jgi:hypothetical protein
MLAVLGVQSMPHLVFYALGKSEDLMSRDARLEVLLLLLHSKASTATLDSRTIQRQTVHP